MENIVFSIEISIDMKNKINLASNFRSFIQNHYQLWKSGKNPYIPFKESFAKSGSEHDARELQKTQQCLETIREPK